MIGAIKSTVFKTFGWRLHEMHTSHRLLGLPRIERKDISSAIELARKNHPTSKLYVLSEEPRWMGPEVGMLLETRQVEILPPNSVVVLACDSDQMALKAVRIIQKREGIVYYGAMKSTPMARLFHRDKALLDALVYSWENRMGKWELLDFENISQAISKTRHLPGDYVEIGVYQGESARFTLEYMKRSGINRKCWFLDTFTGFDYTAAQSSSDGHWSGSHGDTSLESVRQLLSGYSIPHEVHRCNVITDALPATQIAVCNIDVDMYEAVKSALNKVAPLIVPGGIMIAEDQGHTPMLIGAYAATMEFLESDMGRKFTAVELMSGQMFLVKVSN